MDGSKRILIVDDDELQRSLLGRFLAELGHETVFAGSGSQALALLDSGVDLVLLDLLMPDMDGFEVARQIRRNPAFVDIPIMMVTSLEGRQERLAAVSAGANDFIAKPVDRTELTVRARSLLAMKASRDQVKRYQAELEDMVLALKRSGEELEERVRQRTAELARAYEDLQEEVERRRRYEAELVMAKVAAEEANAAKTRFLANISHELRTPLNGIIGMSQILVGTDLSDRQKNLLGMLTDSSETLLRIVTNLLDLSSMELDRFQMDPVAMDIRGDLDALLQPFAVQASSKGLDFTWRVHERVPDQVRLDPAKFHRILSCLLDNSLKYTEEGGIAVDVRLLDQSAWDMPSGAMPLEDGCLLFRIADTGVGIPADRQRHLFQPFVIAEDVLTKKSDGLGLGLSIARMLTEKMGGSIWLESGAGKGTAVYFSLPATGGTAGSIRPGGQ